MSDVQQIQPGTAAPTAGAVAGASAAEAAPTSRDRASIMMKSPRMCGATRTLAAGGIDRRTDWPTSDRTETVG